MQSHDNFTNELQALFQRVSALRERKSESAFPDTEVVDEAFSELQTVMEELQVADEALRHQRDELLVATETIEAERKRYEDLFEFAPDGYLVTDAHGRVEAANRASVSLFGMPVIELNGKYLQELLIEEGAQEVRDRLAILNSAAGSHTTQAIETRLNNPGSSALDVAITVTAIVGRNGAVAGLRWMVRDDSDRKHAEAMRQAAVTAERNRIAAELHDTLAQGFTGIAVQLEAAEALLPPSAERAQRHLARARSLARESLSETRRSVWDLRPKVIQDIALTGAIARTVDQLAAGTSLNTTFETSGTARALPSTLEHNILRICQEALTNALKHAGATTIQVELRFTPIDVQLSIRDNGKGFAPDLPSRPGSFGLTGMRERAEKIGATFTVKSHPGSGTLIHLKLPYPLGEKT